MIHQLAASITDSAYSEITFALVVLTWTSTDTDWF